MGKGENLYGERYVGEEEGGMRMYCGMGKVGKKKGRGEEVGESYTRVGEGEGNAWGMRRQDGNFQTGSWGREGELWGKAGWGGKFFVRE